jgi:hypothetical protein
MPLLLPSYDFIPDTQTPRIPTLMDILQNVRGHWPHQDKHDIFTKSNQTERETGVPTGMPIIHSADDNEILPNVFSSNLGSDGYKIHILQEGIGTLAVLYRGMWSLYVAGHEDTPAGTVVAQRYINCRTHLNDLNPFNLIPNEYMDSPPYVAGPNPLFGTQWAIFDFVLVGTMG